MKQKISMVNDVGELVAFHCKYFIKSSMKYMLEKNINPGGSSYTPCRLILYGN